MTWDKRIAAERSQGAELETVQQLERDAAAALWLTEDAFEEKFTTELVRRARQLRVPLPPRPPAGESNEHWRVTAQWVHALTNEGIKQVRKEIRREERWRDERRQGRLVWVTALTGLGGVLVALLSLWLSRS